MIGLSGCERVESGRAVKTCPFFFTFGTRFRNVSVTGTYFLNVSKNYPFLDTFQHRLLLEGLHVPTESRRVWMAPQSKKRRPIGFHAKRDSED
jgi:hypothetical protein